MPEFLSHPSVEIARRLEIRGRHAWLAVLRPAAGQGAALGELQTELRSVLDTPVRVLALEASTFEQLREAVQQPEDDAVILSTGAGLTREKWSSLDIMRSALERNGPVVLWLTPDEIASLTEFAPNIRSFIGGSIFAAGPDGGLMTETERRERLRELEEHYALTSEEVVRRAERKGLSPEPEFVEWLVLIGRGDLV